MYAASGAVGPEAPEGRTEMVGRLRKVRGGAGEPSDGRRCGVWVGPTNGAGAETARLAALGAYWTPR